MPTKRKEFQFGRLTRQNAFAEYLDGQIWEFSGEEVAEMDLGRGAETLRSTLTSAAHRKGMKIRTKVTEEGGLVVQAYVPEDEAEELE